jgi:hypothetical protein
MGFYIRKSISLGPVRFNLSKSGIGASVGVKGFRVGSGPRGNYVHMGRGGLYYRKTLSNVAQPAAQPAPASPLPTMALGAMQAIDSGDIAQIADASSAELLQELNTKRKRKPLWPWVLGLGAFLWWKFAGEAVVLTWVGMFITAVTLPVYLWDRKRRTTVLTYSFEPEREEAFNAVRTAFQQMMSCRGAWHIEAQGAADRKYNAGASSVVKRVASQFGLGKPPLVKTNIEVPVIPAGIQSLYFFPDRLLVFEKNGVGAVSYTDLTITIKSTHFVEEQSVPGDATQVDRTWRYVNKKGGPDRRFSNNRELPIMLYEEVHFQSDSGLNELINLSRTGMSQGFGEALARLTT